MSDVLRCSFCMKTQHEVKKLVAGPDKICICDECTGLCATIMVVEATERSTSIGVFYVSTTPPQDGKDIAAAIAAELKESLGLQSLTKGENA